MLSHPRYRKATAVSPSSGKETVVIVREDGAVHRPATRWLEWLRAGGTHSGGASSNTVASYAQRVAWFLSWIAQTKDWRETTVSDLIMFRRALFAAPIRRQGSSHGQRSSSTVSNYLAAVRSYLTWAHFQGLLATSVASEMTQERYFPAGTSAGGEHGRHRRVMIPELQTTATGRLSPPEWVEDAEVRDAIDTYPLIPRDRFLIDLLSWTGIRVGEALSLFWSDMHLGGGSRELGCPLVDPHFHISLGNETENGARAKGGARALFPAERLIDSYLEYLEERESILSSDQKRMSQHVLVNLYGGQIGAALTYSSVKRLMQRMSRALRYPLTGPHILRHTFATRLINGIDCDAVDVLTVQKILGHRSLKSTQVYTHVEWNRQREVLQTLPGPRAGQLVGVQE